MTRDDISGASPAQPRVLYVVTEDWAFLSHRLPMARAARDAGFEVHVATRVSHGAAAIEAERFTLHPIPFARGSLHQRVHWPWVFVYVRDRQSASCPCANWFDAAFSHQPQRLCRFGAK